MASSPLPSPRLSSHFLPKFDNQSEGVRLTSATAATLAVSKKHSGHLVMAPPFYSKNGVANRFSRLGEMLLRAHFCAVWPGEGAEAFERWWTHAEDNSLCYSFECVAPRIAGDHGATPKAAYMVLTCVVHAGGDGILSPAQLLELGAVWRLPLNEVWYVPWHQAAAVEDELHAARWSMADSDADALLEGFGVPQQRFLRHGETQGDVLEGFVLMALDQPIEALLPLLAAYESAVVPHREAALAAALSLGDACLNSDTTLIKTLEAPVTDATREPTRVSMSSDEVWDLATTGDGPLPRLFRMLRAVYSHKVRLKPYDYRGRLQLHIDVCDDQVFFGWKLHMALCGTAQLYRGMVVTFDTYTPPPLVQALRDAPAAAAGASDLPLDPAIIASKVANAAEGASSESGACVRVLAIAKLKCLRYLIRTFGVRNILNVLLDHGPAAYVRRTQMFASNWAVPNELRPALLATLAAWPQEVALLTPSEREELRNSSDGAKGKRGSYLRYLEPFLEGRGRIHMSAAEGGLRALAASRLRGYALLIINLGSSLSKGQLEQYSLGLVTLREPGAHKQMRPGSVLVVTRPPSMQCLRSGVPLLVLLFEPQEGKDEHFRKMYNRCSRLESDVPELEGRVFRNLDAEKWIETAAALPRSPLANALADSAGYGAIGVGGVSGMGTEASRAPLERTLVAVAALPPGGGKSSLFRALEALGWGVVSSDVERARNNSFDVALSNMLRTRPLVCYDKNLPDAASLNKVCRLVRAAEERHGLRVRVLIVVPDRIEHDVAWGRVCERTAGDIALSCHIDGGVEKAYFIFYSTFYTRSLALLPLAQTLPGVVVSSAFWESTDAVEQLARELHDRAVQGDVPGVDALADALGSTVEGRAVHTSSYIVADIPGTKLHMTLVPPLTEGMSRHEGLERSRALLALQPYIGTTIKITLRSYHLAAWYGDEAQGRERQGRRRQQLAVWEVEAVEGLPDIVQFGQQRAIYHVTDTAALFGRSAKNAADFMGRMRHGTLGEACDLCTFNPPLELEQRPWVLAQVRSV